MVGLFINTLPMRVRINEGERVSEWLRGLQAEAVEMRQYEHSPLVEVAKWSEMPRGTPLFESLLVFENYPVNNSSLFVSKKVRAQIRDRGCRLLQARELPADGNGCTERGTEMDVRATKRTSSTRRRSGGCWATSGNC